MKLMAQKTPACIQLHLHIHVHVGTCNYNNYYAILNNHQ